MSEIGIWQAVLIAVVTAFLTWIGHAVAAAVQRRSDRDRALEAEKRVAYKLLLKHLYGMLAAAKKGSVNRQMKQFQQEFFDLVRDLTVYASDDVLEEFIKWRRAGEGSKPGEVLDLFARVVLAIRRDLGHEMTSISSLDIWSMFVTDDISQIDGLGGPTAEVKQPG